MKAILLPIRGEAAVRFDESLRKAGKCHPRPISKERETEIVNYINKVAEQSRKEELLKNKK